MSNKIGEKEREERKEKRMIDIFIITIVSAFVDQPQ